MKKYLLLILISLNLSIFAQFTKSSPWMENLEETKKGPFTIFQMNESFNEYWKTHDKSLKGSGYKPFMRWDYHWQNLTDKQGYIISPQEMWTAFNQKNARKNFKSRSAFNIPVSNWEPVGPFTITGTGSWSTGQGRVMTVCVDPNNTNTVYMGTPAGGIWKSINAGTNWTALGDNLPQIGVSGIAVDPNNSNVIYISTGDCDAADTYSIGVLKSIDGGLSWNTTGLTFTDTSSASGDIIIDPTNSDVILVGTSEGIFKSIDAGTNFDFVQGGDFSQGKLRLKPNDPTTIYAVSKNRFFKSTNSGSNFSIITNGMPSNSGRLVMDVSAANSEVIYILSSSTSRTFQGIYKSINAGQSFVKTTSTTDIFENNQSWFTLSLAVSQTNENELYTGCLNIWRSLNGGTTFVKRNSWNSPTSAKYTHADIHYLKFFGNKLYCGSDGGIYVSNNAGTLTNFTNLTATAQIGQFYKIAVSRQSASKMVGGLQDNGGHAYSNGQWKNFYGADGMDTAVDPNNSNKFYGFIQNGSSLYISNNAGNSSSGGVAAPTGENGNWVTPLAINSIGEVYAGYSSLYKLANGNWVEQNAGGFGTNITKLMIDPNNDNIIYAAVYSILYKSTDKGITFNSVYNSSRNITSIEVHSTDSSIVYLTTQGTDGEALKSIDGGTNFISISQGLPNIGKNIIVHQGRNSINPLFIGTSLGVYYRDDSLSQWEPFDNNLPNVSITDLDVNLEDKKITAATFGRGIWQSNIVLELPSIDLKIQSISQPSTVLINCVNSVSPEVTVKNDGQNAITNFDINYTINATLNTFNWIGTLLPNATITIVLPQIILPKGAYNLLVECLAANDAIAVNNIQTSSFFLNDSGTIGQVNPFENTTDELVAYDDSGLSSTWQRGVCTTGVINTGTNNVYATNFTGNYPDVKKSFIVSQCYNLTQITNPFIKFKMAYDLEENWDVVYVEYSVNSGLNWYNLGTAGPNWYNSSRNANTTGNDCNNCPGGQWTGTNSTLTEYSFSLDQLSGFNNIIFRIVFHSDDNTNKLGVVVDDFVIEGSTLTNASFDINKISIYPNPSNAIFKVSIGNTIAKSIEVFDISGKTILLLKETESIGNEIQLNLTNASSGVYFVKISTDEGSVLKRIIKK
jgi:Secretion system C-terminal sorting domain